MHQISMLNTNIKELPTGMHLDTVFADNSALTSVPDFGGSINVNFSFEGAPLTDYSNLSTAGDYGNYESNQGGLFFEEGNDQVDEIVNELQDITVTNLSFPGADINSLNDLSGTRPKNLMLLNSSIKSLDGIEEFDILESLDIRGCHNLTDLSPANKAGLMRNVIDSGMAGLASAVDSSIEVEIRDFDDGAATSGVAAEAESYLKENWDGGSKVFYNGTGNKISVSIWDDSSKTADEADTQRAKEISDDLMDIIEGDPVINHVELHYVSADDKNKDLIVLEDGEEK